ncbi:MAG: DNA polymerase III subunit beta [Acetobacteraceae bacterium]|nr:DNA polymerase III subunit beta [Acetobacteraceae bacterium]
MHVLAGQEELCSGVQVASRALPGRTPAPMFGGVLLAAQGSQLRLVGTDGELRIECWIPAKIKEEGTVVLPGRYLGDILRSLPGGEVEVSAEPSGHVAQLRWGRSEFSIHGFPAQEFPADEAQGLQGPLLIERRALATLLRQTVFAVSRDDARPVLTGAQFTFAQSALEAVATDGFRLAFSRVPMAAASGAAPQGTRALIPGRALAELERLVGAGDEPVGVFLGQRQAAFNLGSARLSTSLIEGQFPNYQQVIPRSFQSRARVSRQALHDACERASLVSRDGSNAVRLSLTPERLEVSAQSPDVGWVREELDLTLEGESMEIAFNARYLMEGLRAADSDEVQFEASGPLSPSRLLTPGGEDFFYLVLPLRPTGA